VSAITLTLTVIIAWAAVMRGILARSKSGVLRTICDGCYLPFERQALGERICNCRRHG
jgi:hypothetical protein